MTRQGRPDHIAELDALRGLMSLWVVLGHALHAVGFPGGDPLWVKPFLANGLAVDVFIILSGFVVTRLLDEKRESYGVYITRRFFRLFPAYVACLLLSVFMLDLVVEALSASRFP